MEIGGIVCNNSKLPYFTGPDNTPFQQLDFIFQLTFPNISNQKSVQDLHYLQLLYFHLLSFPIINQYNQYV